MSPQDLRHAAAKIEAVGVTYECLANKADAAAKPELAALHGAVARQLYDRAGQLLVWAARAEQMGEVTPDVEAGTREFLAYARVS